jgi:hypothetical protein
MATRTITAGWHISQELTARASLSAADWDFMSNPPAAAAGGNAAQPVPLPKRDMVAIEGQPITLGDEKVTPVFIQGIRRAH